MRIFHETLRIINRIFCGFTWKWELQNALRIFQLSQSMCFPESLLESITIHQALNGTHCSVRHRTISIYICWLVYVNQKTAKPATGNRSVILIKHVSHIWERLSDGNDMPSAYPATHQQWISSISFPCILLHHPPSLNRRSLQLFRPKLFERELYEILTLPGALKRSTASTSETGEEADGCQEQRRIVMETEIDNRFLSTDVAPRGDFPNSTTTPPSTRIRQRSSKLDQLHD